MMVLHAGARLLLGLLPVLTFLAALVLLDSYKLMRARRVVMLLLTGAGAAIVSLAINRGLAEAVGLERVEAALYLAPAVEEALKAIPVLVLLARRRVGFLVDAAITGFAVGAGFAAAENLQYFVALGPSSLLLWVVRGFGTALMHGSVTAVLAILAKLLADRHGRTRSWTILPGLVLATAMHSLFNHFFLSPNVSTVVLLLVIPLFFVGVFHMSELRTRDWLGAGFDSDQELLELIHSGEVASSRIGAYLGELKERFPPTVVADMLCLLRLRLELSIQAKGILLMRGAGFPVAPDPEVAAKFQELRYLEHSIGPTGRLAMAPFFHFSDRDLWQYHLLGDG
jgi:protease PrsW